MGQTTPQRKINPYDIKERFYTHKITAHQYFKDPTFEKHSRKVPFCELFSKTFSEQSSPNFIFICGDETARIKS